MIKSPEQTAERISFYPAEIFDGIRGLLTEQTLLRLKLSLHQTQALQSLQTEKDPLMRIERGKRGGKPFKCFIAETGVLSNGAIKVKAYFDERSRTLQNIDISFSTIGGHPIEHLQFIATDQKITEEDLQKNSGVPGRKQASILLAVAGDILGISRKQKEEDPRGENFYLDSEGNIMNILIANDQLNKLSRELVVETKQYASLGPMPIKDYYTGEVKKIYQVYGFNSANIRKNIVPEGTKLQVNLRGLT